MIVVARWGAGGPASPRFPVTISGVHFFFGALVKARGCDFVFLCPFFGDAINIPKKLFIVFPGTDSWRVTVWLIDRSFRQWGPRPIAFFTAGAVASSTLTPAIKSTSLASGSMGGWAQKMGARSSASPTRRTWPSLGSGFSANEWRWAPWK